MLITALKKLKSFGFDPKNILDIGANKGKWSIEVRKKVFPNAEYILIEAIDYEELKKISAKNHNISFLNLLLDDVEHNVTWYEKRNTGDSIYKENTSYFKDCEEIEKKTTTLDKTFSSNHVYEIIKIDCQGAELPILRGGKKLVQNSSVIILEIPFMGEYNIGVPNFFEHIKYMDQINYRVFDIVELHRVDDILIQIDLIFIKKGHHFEKSVSKIIQNLGR
jgi:FkbM family methyltransferase